MNLINLPVDKNKIKSSKKLEQKYLSKRQRYKKEYKSAALNHHPEVAFKIFNVLF